ncbi:related to monosaccharide transporter [Phialocephala subalpina]|uniref:Related to monosaccharide transporter n=1 Tax=Phialocephala subalpina TaxID=576137 RepID=A0A1L7WQ06_9HELO|nr:related to monosaccharide transporter [Phialocephala subalpina]
MTKFHLYFSALTACLTASLFGYSVGFIGGLLVLPSFLSHFHLSNLPANLLAIAQARIVTLWLVGAFFGVLLGMPVCSRWGRKWCLLFSAGMYVCGVGLQLYPVDFGGDGNGALAIFEAGRFLNGLGVGCGTLVSPMYISEISPPNERGMLMSGYQTILQLSALAGFWGAYASNSLFLDTSPLQYRLPIAIQLVPGLLLLFFTLFIPETPRFLAEKGRFDEAETALAWLRGVGPDEDGKVAEELDEVMEAARVSEVLKGRKESFLKEVLKKGVRERLVVGVGLMIAQNMVGLNALNYYAPVIFMSAGFTTVSSSLFLTGVFGVVKLLSAIAFMFGFVRIKGNRFWLLLGSALCGVSMFILAYFVHALPPQDQLADAKLTIGGVISVLTVYIFAFSFSVSLGPISWNVCSEIFPLHINAKCCAVTTCTQWLFQIVIAYITPRLLASIGWATYIIYALFCTLTYIWVLFSVPETRNVALGKEMDQVFAGVKDDFDLEEDVETTVLLRAERGGLRRGSFGTYT